ncbi:histidine--tRNA ligase [Hyphobacterium sp. SN044]|uniref:histidine--tRNA ligase n=1 Tax=Hyphobacterium sp. SN044 TaxID=2912575 RepID=UPI001F005739|nr:histidine--tRNA ligase [Hyphobacterium sp. SN044]MCF8880563.1 histidine--tRNA ligase [Hyphobacterium sp. SN044]
MSGKKAFKPKARRPRGFEDKPASVLRAEFRLIEAAVKVYDAWGFEPLQTPAFEYADALGKFLPDEERPNEGVFALEDDDGQWMALRYDLTAPLARFAAENFQDLAKPFRRYQYGDVWRNEKPGPGRFRQFVQCDADTVGAAGPAADAEMIALASEVMRAAGLKDGEYVVRVNDRRILDGVLEGIGASDPGLRMKVLRAADKLDRLGRDGVAALLGAGRKDESGDFTEGAKLPDASIEKVLAFLDSTGGTRGEVIARLAPLVSASETGEAGLAALTEIDAVLTALMVGEDRAVFDPSIVRGLGYYTGPVFEAELLATATYADGQPMQFGSVGGGGRYDDLVARFTGQLVPATGFSFGVSRFAAALAALERGVAEGAEPLVIVLNLEKDRAADYLALAAELRGAGVRAEAFLGGGNMGKQLKYADRRGADIAVIIGEDERQNGQATIKDLKLGAKLAAEIEDNRTWREEQPAQETVARGDLVKAILGRIKGANG